MTSDAQTPPEGGLLATAYQARTQGETKDLYERWAASYDAEVASNGYATPARCVDALFAHAPDAAGPILDIGCGTGLVGRLLAMRGVSPIDGIDLATAMLEKAKDTGAYRTLTAAAMDAAPRDAYAHAIAAGVFSPSHAPSEAMADGLGTVSVGGLFIFSLNDHALEDPGYGERIDTLIANGAAELVQRAHGPHLPGINLGAEVVALRRLR